MRIAICDNDKNDLKVLMTQVRKYGELKGFKIQLDCFSSGEELLKSPRKYDVITMDICMDGLNGIETVKKLETNICSHVIFVSVSREYAVEAFGVQATHYLLKPVADRTLFEALDRCRESGNGISEKIIRVKSNQMTVPVVVSKIIYIEVFNKISTIHTDTMQVQTYMSLDLLSEQLDDNIFMRAQRSFIVNMKFIVSVLSDHIVMQDGTEITLSRNNRAELKRQYQQFLFGYARQKGMLE